jgi:hypothetical protein
MYYTVRNRFLSLVGVFGIVCECVGGADAVVLLRNPCEENTDALGVAFLLVVVGVCRLTGLCAVAIIFRSENWGMELLCKRICRNGILSD